MFWFHLYAFGPWSGVSGGSCIIPCHPSCCSANIKCIQILSGDTRFKDVQRFQRCVWPNQPTSKMFEGLLGVLPACFLFSTDSPIWTDSESEVSMSLFPWPAPFRAGGVFWGIPRVPGPEWQWRMAMSAICHDRTSHMTSVSFLHDLKLLNGLSLLLLLLLLKWSSGLWVVSLQCLMICRRRNGAARHGAIRLLPLVNPKVQQMIHLPWQDITGNHHRNHPQPWRKSL